MVKKKLIRSETKFFIPENISKAYLVYFNVNQKFYNE